ncbi:hypothetical protein GDO81_008202 [Engystomops pustulosus]|uniref:Vacuolar protein 8 n=1 Tax=Engystomops pustulosus TaxID=76066 RepID=A0AAV7CCV7_ENGPU|nr:hypothetical protein GDO81_008202 [Engystomops pustulosus]
MGRLCERCAQLLQDFGNFVRSTASRVAERIKELAAELRECCCLTSRKTKVKQLYEPVLPQHEREAAEEFLKHLEIGPKEWPPSKETLDALMTVAFSESTELQHSAALYYLHISQNMTTQLPPKLLEPYLPLLQSSDLEVQQMSSLSLVNFLLQGNVNKEQVVHVGLLEPILEMLESGDSAIQCNSCACIMTLAISEYNCETIGLTGGFMPLLTLAKSYDPRVQQNAVGAILNLTRSERIKSIMCHEGALPVLTLLLQSADAEIQYYSCASLGNIAANSEYHKAMLAIGDKFLLRMLVSLMSSTVQKVSSQACLCLNNLASNAEVRGHLLNIDFMPLFPALLNSSNKDVRQASVTLLCTLSHPPRNLDAFVCKDMLQHLAILMQMERANHVVIIHTSCIMENICRAGAVEVLVRSQCFEELLLSLLDPMNDEESIGFVVECLAELTKHEFTLKYLYERKGESPIKCLVRMAMNLENKDLSFKSATVIRNLSHSGASNLKYFKEEVQDYLTCYLSHPELRFQQMAISTLCSLSEGMLCCFTYLSPETLL